MNREDDEDETGRAILVQLEATASRIPACLDAVRGSDDALPPLCWLDAAPLASVGVGLSGGPARLFASRAAALGHCARFVPPSELARAEPLPLGTLVLFSQGMSPNARLAARVAARERVAFTGVDPEGEDAQRVVGPTGWVVPIPSDEAHGRMVRLQAPITSAYAALRWLARAHPEASWAEAVDAAPEAWAAAFESARARVDPELARRALRTPAVFVTAGRDPAEVHHLAWKWAEALFDGPPLVIDVLELAHGPLQAFFEGDRTIFAMIDPGTESLFRRLETVLEPARHRVIPLEAQLPAPLSMVEHDAALDAWILAALEADPRRLTIWPARHRDGPLYAFEG